MPPSQASLDDPLSHCPSPKMQGDADGDYFFFSAPASPVHYILRSPPSSTAAAASSPYFAADADCCAASGGAGDFEFALHGAGMHGGPAGTKGGGVAMSSAEELFVAGRIRVGCLSPIRQEDGWEDSGGGGGGNDEDEDEERERDRDGRSPRATTRRARSVSPTRSPRAAAAEPSHPFASASASSSSSSASSSSSSSSAKNIQRRISLRDLLSRTGTGADQASSGGTAVTSRLGFWPPSIWPSRSSKKSSDSPMSCPAPPQPGRRLSTSSDRAAAPTTAKKRAQGGSTRRTTSLPYRQGLVLGCLGFGARGYGLAKSMHPLPTR